MPTRQPGLKTGLCVGSVALLLAVLPIPSNAWEALEGKRSPGEIIAASTSEHWRDIDPANLLVMNLEEGRIVVELAPDFAPAHVAQMTTLVTTGFYDGLSFYRVIDGFVAQGGDVFEKGGMPEGTTKSLKAELTVPYDLANGNHTMLSARADISRPNTDGYAPLTGIVDGFPVGFNPHKEETEAWLLHCTGAMAMARDTDPDTGGTEFYFTLQPQRYLDRNLTVFGIVRRGMDVLQGVTRQAPPEDETDPMGDIIQRAWMGNTPPEGEDAPALQVLQSGTELFAEYVESRRNRPEAFWVYRPDHVDICQLPIPVREKPQE